MNPSGALKCPKCGDGSGIISHGKRYAVYPSGCLVIGGFPIAMLHQTSCPTDYECLVCNTRFGVRSLIARICLGIIVLVALWIIVAIGSIFTGP